MVPLTAFYSLLQTAAGSSIRELGFSPIFLIVFDQSAGRIVSEFSSRSSKPLRTLRAKAWTAWKDRASLLINFKLDESVTTGLTR